jgi:23S rRNA (cytosine1962-C5)-methyltransferase
MGASMEFSQPMYPIVKIGKKGVERWKAGHPWIYEADIEKPPELEGGEIVRVEDGRNFFLGLAFFSKASKISLRWITWDNTLVDKAFWTARLKAADALRQRAVPGQKTYRVVHGEADLIPGLVVDRFEDCLSVQFLVKATDSQRAMWIEILCEHFSPQAIVNRSDANVRKLEGLELEKGILFGHLPKDHFYKEGQVEFKVDLLEGQKTGAFLDQRDNHVMSSHWAFGEALDCFSYAGGFALQLAQKATHVTAVEISESACGLIRDNAAHNQITNVEVVCTNAFDYLRDALDEGKKFDTIVLDPPSFAKNKGAIEPAVRGYKEINLRAMQLLRPGGILITASCTYHIDETRFEGMLDSAAMDSKRRVQILQRHGAGIDHPVLLSLRETRYLKCFVLRVL